jgi:hypothetical protein
MHHVAALAAELRRIHIGRAAIAGHRHHQKVHDGGCQNDVHAMTEDLVVKIYLGKLQRNHPSFLQFLAAYPHAYRDQR